VNDPQIRFIQAQQALREKLAEQLDPKLVAQASAQVAVESGERETRCAYRARNGCQAGDLLAGSAFGRPLACGGHELPGCVADWISWGGSNSSPYPDFVEVNYRKPAGQAWTKPRPGVKPDRRRK
jgi:hypothetical protein